MSKALLPAFLLSAALLPFSAAIAHADSKTHSTNFLKSVSQYTGIEVPRLELAADRTFLAHPSLLQRWGVIASDAAAAYNSLTNTLVLQPEMTIDDPVSGGRRIRTLFEISQALGSGATVSAGVILHELSHAEWEFFVEPGATPADAKLMATINDLLPAVDIGFFRKRLLPSEVYAYYREDLFFRIMSDASEILLSSGLNPDTLACSSSLRNPGFLRDLFPDGEPYETRVKLDLAWVQGKDFSLRTDLDPLADRINRALFEHAMATSRIPLSRKAVFEWLSRKPQLIKKIESCASQPKPAK